MNIYKQLTLSIMFGISTCFLGASAYAATDTSDLVVYKFMETKSATIDKTRSYMKQFLPREDFAKLEIPKTNIVRYVSADDVNTTLEHNVVTGDLSFKRNFGRYIKGFIPKLPSEDEAVKYALEFLKNNNLMPTNPEELKVAHVGGLRSTTVVKGEMPGRIIDKLKSITFSRELKGVPVIGAGSKMLVNIGDNGEVIGVIRRWRELGEPTRLSPMELLTEKEAKEMAQKQILNEFGNLSRVEIMQTQLAYYDNNGKTIQPVFAFQTKIQLSDKRLPTIEYVSVVPAMRKPIEDLKLTQLDNSALKLIQSDNSVIPEASGKDSD